MSRSSRREVRFAQAGDRSHQRARRARLRDLRTSGSAPAVAQRRERRVSTPPTTASARPSARSMRPPTTSSFIRSISPTTRWSSPTVGRIQYRISNVGEVLPAGGKVFTMLDFTDVYMDIYLPTAEAGRARIGVGRADRARRLSEVHRSRRMSPSSPRRRNSRRRPWRPRTSATS